MTWLRLCRLDPGVINFQKPDLVQPLQAGPWRRFGLFRKGCVHDLVQPMQTGPWRQLCSPYYHGLAWFSLTCSGPVTCTGLLPLGASVVTVDVDVVVDEFAGVVEKKLLCLGAQISRVVTPQKYNQLIWLSSR